MPVSHNAFRMALSSLVLTAYAVPGHGDGANEKRIDQVITNAPQLSNTYQPIVKPAINRHSKPYTAVPESVWRLFRGSSSVTGLSFAQIPIQPEGHAYAPRWRQRWQRGLPQTAR